jgi:glycosyltransferase involved in cell wall biosynthesis
MLTAHRVLGTWTRRVDSYVALTEFARKKFVQGGLPAEKIVVKPNFVDPDPGPGTGRGGYALFVGRLSLEKGLDALLAAWERLGGRYHLKIVGEGPLSDKVVEVVRRVSGVQWLGRKPREEVYRLMGDASLLVFPSECYENLPGVIIEAFAKGTPVVASDLGSMSGLVRHGHSGLRFRPGEPDDLAAQVAWAFEHPAELDRMRREARREYDLNYTAERNYQMLLSVYRSAVERGNG